MEITISSNTNKPIYEQITTQIKAQIVAGELQAGDAIPSMRALAKALHVSVITVQKAYMDLQRDGFITTTIGRGSFVSAQNKEFYQEEQLRRAEEHLQEAANIGRSCNIPLEKLVIILREAYSMENKYILLVIKEYMWAEMLIQVLKDNNIPVVSEPVNGAGFSIKTGIPERLRVYVPKEYQEQATELLNTLFPQSPAQAE